MCFLLETKSDRKKPVDPKLLFPLKEWFLGFLPGHEFSWDVDESAPKTDGLAERVSNEISLTVKLFESEVPVTPINYNYFTKR